MFFLCNNVTSTELLHIHYFPPVDLGCYPSCSLESFWNSYLPWSGAMISMSYNISGCKVLQFLHRKMTLNWMFSKMAFMLQPRLLHLILMGALPKPQWGGITLHKMYKFVSFYLINGVLDDSAMNIFSLIRSFIMVLHLNGNDLLETCP